MECQFAINLFCELWGFSIGLFVFSMYIAYHVGFMVASQQYEKIINEMHERK